MMMMMIDDVDFRIDCKVVCEPAHPLLRCCEPARVVRPN